MAKDLKTGMFAGAVVAVCATVLLSLFSSTVEQRGRGTGSNETFQSVSGSESANTGAEGEIQFFSREHIEPKINDERMTFLLSAGVSSEVASEQIEEQPALVEEEPVPAETVSNKPKEGKVELHIHEVKTGETLTGISTQYFGTSGRFLDIYNLNRDVIQDMNKLQPGMKIRIPKD